MFRSFCITLLVWGILSAHAQSTEKPSLFSDIEILNCTLKAPIRDICKDKEEDAVYHAGTLSYTNSAGSQTELKVEVKTRGNFRRSMCPFPPLRLKIDSLSSQGTLFEGQDKIKLITHCNSKQDLYEQVILEEYLLYRSYNLLTDSSFRVRLVRITYDDSERPGDTLTRYGFLLEPEEKLAARLNGILMEQTGIHANQTYEPLSVLMSVFEYMAGNTDWSVSAQHNVRIVRTTYDVAPLPIPYDLDWSGVISAPYAIPRSELGLSSVRERIYRGFCKPEATMEAAFVRFREKKEAIYALYRSSGFLPEKTIASTLKYYDEFYDIINDPKAVKREFMLKCRK